MITNAIISEGMVLQRGNNTVIYGQAIREEKIELEFLGKTYKTLSDEEGKWKIKLCDLKAGGPYEMTIKDPQTKVIKDILIGDVWVCGGQSNMELPIARVLDSYKEEIMNYENDNIRQFLTEQNYCFDGPKDNLEGGSWKKLNAENVLDFSAAGYFFAKELYEKYKVPIGLIQTAVGGTPAEAWISEHSLKKFKRFDEIIEKCKESSYVREVQMKDDQRINDWYERINLNDEGYKDKDNRWYEQKIDDSSWDDFYIPQKWRNTKLDKLNGCVWFRKKVNIPESMAGCEAYLHLGAIIDSDYAYVNGVLVGETGYRYPPRKYKIPKGTLRAGENLIALRVMSNTSIGEFIKDKPYKIAAENGEEVDLEGDWKCRIGCRMEYLEDRTFFQYKPCGLFNGVIHPLKDYNICGVIWYQGESNDRYPDDYGQLFETVIKEWRSNWHNDNLPFLYVQLANYGDIADKCCESRWAEVREHQRRALKIKNTGMASAVDIGEYNDLHPQNKKDLGKRLALLAEKIVFKEDVVCSGPLYESKEIDGKYIYLNFSSIGSGLTAKDGRLEHFSICGEDKKYVEAHAEIIGSKVRVYNEKVNHPVEVRYCWADSPHKVTLYNKEGLPASPFSTEE